MAAPELLEVRPGLYLGGVAASERSRLREAGVSAVLTVDTEEPSGDVEGLQTLFISARDEPETDLLSQLDRCVGFIGRARADGAAVLVHWTPKGTGGNTDFHLKGRSVGGERCSQSRKSTKPFLEERSQAVTKATFSFPWELLDYADKRVCLRVQDHGCTGIFLILRCPAWVPQQIMSAQGSFMFDAFRGSCMLWVRCYWKIWQLKKTSHAGISRSVAVVTAYLMKTEQLPFEDAYGSLQTIKPEAKMNEGFEWQLKLYQAMGCEVDTSSAIYKQYRLQKVTEKYPELQNLPQEVFAIDPTLISQELKNEILYKCRKCRRSLFRSSSILDHSEGSGPAAFAHKKMTPLIINIGNEATCTSYFIEPVQWMESALLGVMDGQLLCPKCNAKLGSFNWYGEQCSCGRWMTPAFQIHKNRVDEMKMLPLLGSQARKT